MAWHTSDRKSRLPDNWSQLRVQVGKRDRWTCQHIEPSGAKCGKPGNQVDHIIPSGPDSLSNLQVLCEMHHAIKSSSEGGRARQASLREQRERLARPAEIPPQEARPPGVPTKHKGF